MLSLVNNVITISTSGYIQHNIEFLFVRLTGKYKFLKHIKSKCANKRPNIEVDSLENP